MNCLRLFTARLMTMVDDSKHWNKSCDGEHCFFYFKKRGFNSQKKLQYTALSIKLHHFTLGELKTQVFTLSDVLAPLSIHCAHQKQHSNPDFLTNSVNITLQTCADITNEYLEAHKIGIGMKTYLFYSLHQCKCADYTMFLLAFVLSK